MTTRGERNNNPLNLERTSDHWQGQDVPQLDPRFSTFRDAVFCYREGARIVREHFATGRDTIEKIVAAYAPDTENNTEAYIADVVGRMGIARDSRLNITRAVGDRSDLLPLLAAFTWHENGEDIYPDSIIQHGMDLEITL
jgi:hypothetical protein